MSEPIPALLPCAALFLASAAVLLALARTVLPASSEPASAGRHRRTARPLTYRTVARSHRPQKLLAGEANRAVRPYVVAAERAARRRESELAALGLAGHGPYVMHGVEAA